MDINLPADKTLPLKSEKNAFFFFITASLQVFWYPQSKQKCFHKILAVATSLSESNHVGSEQKATLAVTWRHDGLKHIEMLLVDIDFFLTILVWTKEVTGNHLAFVFYVLFSTLSVFLCDVFLLYNKSEKSKKQYLWPLEWHVETFIDSTNITYHIICLCLPKTS